MFALLHSGDFNADIDLNMQQVSTMNHPSLQSVNNDFFALENSKNKHGLQTVSSQTILKVYVFFFKVKSIHS